MPSEHEFLKARLAYVRQDLEGVLRRLRDSDLSWKPAEGMPSIADLLLEIANKVKEVPVWLQSGEWPDGDPDAFDVESATVEGIKSAFGALRTQTYAYIDSLSQADLDELVQCPQKWWEALRLTACPRSEVIRNIAAHEWYHTGQLITYLWIRGDNPNDW